VELLIYLVKFYDVQGYETWKKADARSNSQKSISDLEDEGKDEQDSDEWDQMSLEEAVRTYPHMAVEALSPINWAGRG
jgi:hypothetical protein